MKISIPNGNQSVKRVRFLLSNKTGYIVGLALGMALIAINVYVAVFMISVLNSRVSVPVQPGISLPVIQTDNYNAAKEEYENRSHKQTIRISDRDPFN